MSTFTVATKFSELSRSNKESIGLLSVGTFLEYFDLMIYVHMASLLNQLFFPKVDPDVAVLLQAFSFCTTFVFRPLGALIIGFIGDIFGRRSTVIITTLMMAMSCVVIANLPTYAQIGIAASWFISLCRIFQGISSVGEIVGAELYLTEITRPPVQYPIVSCIALVSMIGSCFAIFVVNVVLNYGFNWRTAFWLGACVSIVGAVARTTLRETTDFANAKKTLQLQNQRLNLDTEIFKNRSVFMKQKVDKKLIFYLFIMHCAWPVFFYLAYVYMPGMLKNNFNYTLADIARHNFLVSLCGMSSAACMTFLIYKIYPLFFVKIKLILFSVFVLFLPHLLTNVSSPNELFLIQAIIASFSGVTGLIMPILFKHIPVFKRFTFSSVIYALSRALMYVITSFGMIYAIKFLGFYGLFIITIPIYVGSYFGILYFEKLEIQAGNHPRKNSVGDRVVLTNQYN